MKRTQLDRTAMLQAMAAHVLEHGLSDASLRPLAKAAGTSDRMLIYHFGNKQGLMGALLDYIADGYSASLDAVLPPGRGMSREAFLGDVAEITRGPDFAPYIVLWWQIVAESGRGNQTYRDPAQRIMQKLLGWIEDHLPADDPDPAGAARQMLTLIEGAQMLDAVGCRDIGDVALARAFAAP